MRKFKSSFYLFIGLLSMGILSCDSDDDEPEITHAIVGTWAYESHSVAATVNGQNMIEFLISNLGFSQTEAIFLQNLAISQFINTAEFQGTTMQFMADGTYQITSPSSTESGTYELKNDNTILALHDGEEEIELEVTELTDNFMTVIFEEEEGFDITEDGNEETIIGLLTLRVQKQN